MTGNHLSIIMLPASKCNVTCDYCFEDKTRATEISSPLSTQVK